MKKHYWDQNITTYIKSTDPEDRKEFEENVFAMVLSNFAKNLPKPEDVENDVYNSIDIWDSEVSGEIMCRTEELAKMVLGIIRSISGEDEKGEMGCYYREYDEKYDCVDDRTDWWFVRDEEGLR